MSYRFPTYRAAAVQAAAVFMDRAATTDKACSLIREAARNGARLVVFPETYIAGYPHWSWSHNVREADRFYPLLVKSSVTVPSDVTDRLGRTAREADIFVAMGINEAGSTSFAEVFNTFLLIGADGRIIARHRKTIPTFYEKLVWSYGDASAIRAYDTELGRLGMLVCGENSNALARFALIAQAEQVHLTNYPSLPQVGQVGNYSIKKAIEIRSAAHSFEGKVFTIASSSIIDDDIKQLLGDTPERKEILRDGGVGFTGIVHPSGGVIAGPVPDNEEGIVYADLDLTDGIKWKLYHDYSGNYNRFDLFSLNINREPRAALHEIGPARPAAGGPEPALERLQGLLQQVEDDGLRAELQRAIATLARRPEA
jgi:predicted amidohydrolase